MPAHDRCEPQVIAALEKENWQTIANQITLALEDEHYVYVDLQIQHRLSNEQVLIVEVKCFNDPDAELGDFYQAIGQYLYYRNALKELGIVYPLFLAIPEPIYQGLFKRSTAQMMLKEVKINLLVVNLKQEVITSWHSY